jgi:hypothetical protein|tara:strand:+ start:2032 stop:2910 length:879 start_codon:yes stop_codon:yes gene_type:complete
MSWFAILKYYEYVSMNEKGREKKSREDFLKIISNNAELDLPEIERRAEEGKKKETELINTIKDMDIKYKKALAELTAKRDARKSKLEQAYSTSDRWRFRKQVEAWNNKIEEFKDQYETQITKFKDAVNEQKDIQINANYDLEQYKRYHQSGEEFIDMAYEYGWHLPDELDSFLRTLNVIHGVTPEAIEGIIGLMPQKTEGENTNRWKNGLRRTDIPMQGEEKIMQVIQQLIGRGIAPKDITKYTIHDELGIDHRDLGTKWNKKDDEQLNKLIEMRAKSYRPMSEAERKWRGL